jgi:hypothetical protein
MKLDLGMHIGLHLVSFGKSGVTPFPQSPVGAIRPPREPLPYVLPKLFDETTDRAHRSYHFAICGAQLGFVCFRGPGHYTPLHPVWCLRRTTSIYPGGDGRDFGGRGLPLRATVLRGAHGAVDLPTRGATISSRGSPSRRAKGT